MNKRKARKHHSFPNQNTVRMTQPERNFKEIETDDSTSVEEKVILQDYIIGSRAKVIVEIGTHRGLTTLYLAEAALKTGGHVYTYDPIEWNASGTFSAYPDLPITYFKRPALESTIDNIDFLFVDGYHEKEYVLGEIDFFFPRLNDGAIVVFHDAGEGNSACDVPGAIQERNLSVEYINTKNVLAVYKHNK